tara:strand:- start:8 stop:970 length:963 start_codon:yes stop_codon:yes gene_type:complete
MTGIAIATYAGLALSAGGMGASFLQAAKQRRAQEDIDADAAEVMAAARKKLEVNYLDALAVQKKPYELEREALLVAGAQGVDASRESERGAAAGVGRVQLAQQKGQQGVRTAMGQEMTALDKAAAAEESRLRDVGVQLDLGEVAGAQMASADAGQAAAAAQTQGFQQLASFGAQAVGAANLYSKSPEVRASNKAYRQANRAGKADYMKANPDAGFLGIGTGYRQESGVTGRQGVLNQSTFDQTIAGNKDFINQFNAAQGKQGVQFNEKQFLDNPQAFINRGSVQQQELFQNALYGFEMNPIEDGGQAQNQFIVNTPPMGY